MMILLSRCGPILGLSSKRNLTIMKRFYFTGRRAERDDDIEAVTSKRQVR